MYFRDDETLTRDAWVSDTRIVVAANGYHFLVLRLAVKNGRPSWARRWLPGVTQRFGRRMLDLFVGVDGFDVTEAFEDAVSEVRAVLPNVRARVETDLGKLVPIRRLLSNRDDAKLWSWIRAAVPVRCGPWGWIREDAQDHRQPQGTTATVGARNRMFSFDGSST